MGLVIIQVIVNGEQDPHELAAYLDRRVKTTQEEIGSRLHGNWQTDLLFRLKQSCRPIVLSRP